METLMYNILPQHILTHDSYIKQYNNKLLNVLE